MLTPDWTPAMQQVWDRAMMITKTRGAYGLTFPLAGTSSPPPQPGTMLYDLCFTCAATEAEYEAHLAAVREDMVAWKAGIGSARPARYAGIDLSKLELDL